MRRHILLAQDLHRRRTVVDERSLRRRRRVGRPGTYLRLVALSPRPLQSPYAPSRHDRCHDSEFRPARSSASEHTRRTMGEDHQFRLHRLLLRPVQHRHQCSGTGRRRGDIRAAAPRHGDGNLDDLQPAITFRRRPHVRADRVQNTRIRVPPVRRSDGALLRLRRPLRSGDEKSKHRRRRSGDDRRRRRRTFRSGADG